jgi:DNA/RNA endonuclease YhcR with UshA esterase domain
MIKIEKNPNFSNWRNIFAFGKLVEQVQGRAKAVRIAKQIAIDKKQDSILVEGELLKFK